MQTIILTAFDNKKPLVTTIASEDHIIIYDLFRPGSGKTIYEVNQCIQRIKDQFGKDDTIVTNDMMSHAVAFGITPGDLGPNVYDFDCGKLSIANLKPLADRLLTKRPRPYQRILAQVAPVYAELSRNGVLISRYTKVNPMWDLNTHSKRSKCLNFNLQGFVEDVPVHTPYAAEDDCLVCFDWIAADIRSVACLSEDNIMSDAFLTSDPYIKLKEEIGGDITRDECKTFLLKVINSLDSTDPVISKVFPKLSAWLATMNDKLADDVEVKEVQSLLGKKFINPKNRLSAFNGAIQGTTAHAMHNCMRKIWDVYPTRLIGEIHDSIILNCPPVKSELLKLIKTVSGIMVRPFEGILDNNPIFPVRVSIGKKWRQWKKCYVNRGGGLISEAG